MNYLFFVVLIIFNFGDILSGPLFFRGRPLTKHGMLGIPMSKSFKIDEYELPKDEWFEQKLDHFNPADIRTWKQVLNLMKQ
jgi:hypothetical protein